MSMPTQDAVTVHLPPEIKAALDECTQREGVSPDQLVARAVQQYLALNRFRSLRGRMLPHAESQGISTDQDVFDRVS